MPEESNVSLPSFACNAATRGLQENDEVRSASVQREEPASEDKEGSPEAEGAPETPSSSQVGSLHLACLYPHGQLRYHGVYYAGRLFCRAAGHKRCRA